jgi:hypothetical protein
MTSLRSLSPPENRNGKIDPEILVRGVGSLVLWSDHPGIVGFTRMKIGSRSRSLVLWSDHPGIVGFMRMKVVCRGS